MSRKLLTTQMERYSGDVRIPKCTHRFVEDITGIWRDFLQWLIIGGVQYPTSDRSCVRCVHCFQQWVGSPNETAESLTLRAIPNAQLTVIAKVEGHQ